MTFLRASTLLALSILLPGCKSAPVHLYTLAPAPTFPLPPDNTTSLDERFSVGEFLLPKAIDRKELVVRGANDELIILENAHWASTLREEARRALNKELRLAMPSPETSQPPLVRVDVRVSDWEALANTVYFQAEWHLQRSPNGPLDLQCESRLSESFSGGAAGLVRSDSALLTALAHQIGQALRANPPRCGG